MKRLLLVVTGLVLAMVLAACSSPEADEVLEYHNAVVDEVHPLMDKLASLYEQMTVMETEDEVIDLYDNEIIPVVNEINDYYDGQKIEYDATKEYHKLLQEQANSLEATVLKEKEFFEALLDENTTEEELMTLDQEVVELNTITEEKNKAVADHYDYLLEEYNFIEEDE
ncbi:hypothetical protein H8S33_13265 [Ornithinibacillus sp. BX22]|uniref:Lipoprotein n=2 Tax=Ornithinibacillus TaxID=484508 RepID=A0A923L7H3_9BACI|nr:MULTISPECIES: hypothetical protein [Ornithinibacillus]MBC5637780.1 hypothetical protein [Ornithinibacillus hominis]MBS3681950.1 hypothetical protein [Ornithinibacillus massiliensis]